MAQDVLALCPAEPVPTVDELVEKNVPLVGHLVREMLSRLPQHLSRDDLLSAGMMALALSAQSYDPTRGVPFARFAAIRIRGALIDELRGMDWAARSVRGRAREVESAREQLAAALGRTPRRDEVANALGVSPDHVAASESDVARANILSLQGFSPEAGAEMFAEASDGPESLLLLREQLGYLHDAIAVLPERLRFVVNAYFFDQRQMTDIGAELGVTESRVSQLRAEALRLLRDGMNSQLEPSAVDQLSRTGRAATSRQAYFDAIATRSTIASRLSLTTPRGEVVPRAAAASNADQDSSQPKGQVRRRPADGKGVNDHAAPSARFGQRRRVGYALGVG